ncbi:1-phosphofructokinase family hexose kinase [Microbaculum sp. A6E488]|uniref:Phosphofructokinase n=1 Tax=Microbaculum marinisediminis TaxID=2931392 RepID=A0AAW5QXN9_9HYPH|nr:1-phosphofructokinase family hexose kinase [Microbaculum sp. A6E488]
MAGILTITMSPTIDISASTRNVVPIHKLSCSGVRRDPGGGGINVARVVRRFGMECRALYPTGGYTGDFLRALMDKEGVESLHVTIAADTRESFTLFEESSEQEYRFVLPGPELREEEWQCCLDRLAALPHRPAYLVASGSLPPGVPDDFYARVARIAELLGARLVVDSSGAALKAALDAGIYLVKPNLRELRELTGESLELQSEWEDAATALISAGKSEIVALTLGEDGAFLVSPMGCLRATGLQVDIHSAVGAGDSFLAAMVWQLSLGRSLECAFRYGVAAGTAALGTPGTELCRIQDVERLYGEVRVEPVACTGRRNSL